MYKAKRITVPLYLDFRKFFNNYFWDQPDVPFWNPLGFSTVFSSDSFWGKPIDSLQIKPGVSSETHPDVSLENPPVSSRFP